MKQIQKYQKRNLFVQLMAVLFFPAIAAGMLSCSSSDDLAGNASSLDAPHQIILKATAAPESRMVYTEDDANKILNVTWSTDPATKPDTLIVYYKSNGTWYNTKFVQTTDKTADSHNAYFAGTVTGTPTEYVAVVKNGSGYPVEYESSRIYMSYSILDGSLINAANNDILIAKATVQEGSTEVPTLQFAHKISILKLDITLPSSETGTVANSITMSAASGLYNQYYYHFDSSEGYNPMAVYIYSSFQITDRKMTLYFPIISNSTTMQDAKLTFSVGYNFYSVDLGSRTVEPGKFYVATRTISAPYLSAASSANGGNGTKDNPYQIANAAQMWWMKKFTSEAMRSGIYYKLTNDINLENIPWQPIYLDGYFDGNGKTITGLKVETTGNYSGLFYSSDESIIKNLTITNASVSGAKMSGILVGGISRNTTIQNCKVSGNVSSSSFAGGIVGETTTNCSIIGCSSSANVKGTSHTGGIAGYLSNTTVTACYNTGSVESTDNSAGGIAGLLASSKVNAITSCYSTGTITAKFEWAGGIMGEGKASISNCYTTSVRVFRYNEGTGTGTLVTDVNTAAIVSDMNAGIKTWNSGTYNGSNVAGTIHECKYKFVLGTGTGATPTIEAGAPQ